MLDTASNARPAIIRAQEGTTTGISAADRAATFRALASPTAVPSDFNRPGHVFPLRPREGGVLARDGHTEASVDFCRLAGLRECGVRSVRTLRKSIGTPVAPEEITQPHDDGPADGAAEQQYYRGAPCVLNVLLAERGYPWCVATVASHVNCASR